MGDLVDVERVAGIALLGGLCRSWVRRAAAGNYYRKWVVELVALPTHQGPEEGRPVATEALAPSPAPTAVYGMIGLVDSHPVQRLLQSGERIRSPPVTETPSLKI